MATSALAMMIVTETLITGLTVYFFWKVLTSKNDLNTGVKDP